MIRQEPSAGYVSPISGYTATITAVDLSAGTASVVSPWSGQTITIPYIQKGPTYPTVGDSAYVLGLGLPTDQIVAYVPTPLGLKSTAGVGWIAASRPLSDGSYYLILNNCFDYNGNSQVYYSGTQEYFKYGPTVYPAFVVLKVTDTGAVTWAITVENNGGSESVADAPGGGGAGENVETDPNDNLYISNVAPNYTVYSTSGAVVSTFVGSTSLGAAPPNLLSFDTSGNLRWGVPCSLALLAYGGGYLGVAGFSEGSGTDAVSSWAEAAAGGGRPIVGLLNASTGALVYVSAQSGTGWWPRGIGVDASGNLRVAWFAAANKAAIPWGGGPLGAGGGAFVTAFSPTGAVLSVETYSLGGTGVVQPPDQDLSTAAFDDSGNLLMYFGAVATAGTVSLGSLTVTVTTSDGVFFTVSSSGTPTNAFVVPWQQVMFPVQGTDLQPGAAYRPRCALLNNGDIVLIGRFVGTITTNAGSVTSASTVSDVHVAYWGAVAGDFAWIARAGAPGTAANSHLGCSVNRNTGSSAIAWFTLNSTAPTFDPAGPAMLPNTGGTSSQNAVIVNAYVNTIIGGSWTT